MKMISFFCSVLNATIHFGLSFSWTCCGSGAISTLPPSFGKCILIDPRWLPQILHLVSFLPLLLPSFPLHVWPQRPREGQRSWRSQGGASATIAGSESHFGFVLDSAHFFHRWKNCCWRLYCSYFVGSLTCSMVVCLEMNCLVATHLSSSCLIPHCSYFCFFRVILFDSCYSNNCVCCFVDGYINFRCQLRSNY